MRYVYLHGFASGPGSKKAGFFRERFGAMGLTLETPDLAEGDFEHLTLSGQLGVVERAVAEDEAVLIGSSLGGYVAALYAARHAEVRRLILMAPAFCFPTRWRAELGDERMEEWRRTGRMAMYHYGHGGPRDIGYGLVEDGRQYEDFPDFPQPALIFHGVHDDVVPAALSQQFAVTHSKVTLHLVVSGHELLDVLEFMWQTALPFLG